MKVNFKQHFLFWFFFIAVNYGIRMVEYLWYKPLVTFCDLIIKHGLGIAVFYIVLFSCINYSQKDKLLLWILYFFILLFYGTVRYCIYNYIFHFIDGGYKSPYSYLQSYASGFWFFYQYSLFAVAYYIFLKSQITIKTLLSEQQKNHQLHTQNLTLEYKFLRAQINPHFLYNVLGFFYSKVKSQDENAGRGVLLLTEMMRYSIREPEADDKVALKEELHAIDNLLELQNLRFENNAHARVSIQPGMNGLRIVPHILVTLVENACKHGDLTDADDPMKISGKIDEGWFVFEVINRVRTGRLVEHGDGFGLENLASRLFLQYSENQQFKYGKVDSHFNVTFRLNTNIMRETEAEVAEKLTKRAIEKEQNIPTVWLPA